MPSPDLQSYSSLTLYDVDPRALVDRAVTDGLVKFPGWTPREGNTELALIELLGLEVAEAVFAINRLPDAVVEVLMRLFGITRNLGAPAAATATFTLSDALGHVIPAGTRVRLELAAGQAVDFTTDVALVVAGGAVAGTVAITAVTSTADANGTGPGVSLALVDAVPYIETVVTATADPAWLPWLAQLVGARLPAGLSTADRRAAVAGAVAGYFKGTKQGIEAAARAALTGTKYVRVIPLYAGDQWRLEVRTRTSETASTAAVAAAIVAANAKPAGVELVATAYEATWAQVEAAYPTWAALEANAPTWLAVEETGAP
jgi:hypothetical protein